MEEKMVVVNCGSQAIHKFRMNGRTVLEHKIFVPKVAVECSREMGEALLKKHSNPNMAVFFRNPADPAQRMEIERMVMPGMGRTDKAFAKVEKAIEDDNAGISGIEGVRTKRKYVRRK